jgi:hypothetical protein
VEQAQWFLSDPAGIKALLRFCPKADTNWLQIGGLSLT